MDCGNRISDSNHNFLRTVYALRQMAQQQTVKILPLKFHFSIMQNKVPPLIADDRFSLFFSDILQDSIFQLQRQLKDRQVYLKFFP